MTAQPVRRPTPVREIVYLAPEDVTLDEADDWVDAGGPPMEGGSRTTRLTCMAMWAARRRAGYRDAPLDLMARTTIGDLGRYAELAPAKPAAADEVVEDEDPTAAAESGSASA